MRRLVDGQEFEFPDLELEVSYWPDRLLVHTPSGTHSAVVVRHSGSVGVSFKGRQVRLEHISRRGTKAATHASGELRAPMPGTVVAVKVKEGDEVSKGTILLVIEAMKTQQPFIAPFDAVVERLPVTIGEGISEGTLLAFLRSPTDTHSCVSE